MELTTHILEYCRAQDGELIAEFGAARLVRRLNGRCEVRGGSTADLEAARLWCAIFCRDVPITWPACPCHARSAPPIRRRQK